MLCILGEKVADESAPLVVAELTIECRRIASPGVSVVVAAKARAVVITAARIGSAQKTRAKRKAVGTDCASFV
ncbi:unnamed protein product [Gongylonema pulchrum]|uniref:Transposase n=1 Tax=Gongylonema pulchrum TaxID=637853 RepID=A0A183CUN1_9BILA|nr:unnamed protein product [Gongylonema pulchrum]